MEPTIETITREQWNRMPRDYKSYDKATKTRYMLKLVPGKGTCLVPVKVVKS